MAKKSPWHSKVTLDVHHDESTCEVGDNIQPENVVQGDGGLPKCKECVRISG